MHRSSPLLLSVTAGCAQLSGYTELQLSECVDCADANPVDVAPAMFDVAAEEADSTAVDTSDGTTCATNLATCAGGCVDTSSDARHCGGCGRSCADGERCVNAECRTARSCAEIRQQSPTSPSGVYRLQIETPTNVFCDMTGDGGGWTLVMKVDGTKKTFEYDSPFWTNEVSLGAESTNLDEVEHKNAAFRWVGFKAVRVGMAEKGKPIRHLTLAAEASSLFALFTRPPVLTAAGRAAWLALLPDARLQSGCNLEGFNVNELFQRRLRIGIFGNNDPSCNDPDSFIGFGYTNRPVCTSQTEPGVTVGNHMPDGCGSTEPRTIPAFGYVWIR
jgi:hypothetical protein